MKPVFPAGRIVGGLLSAEATPRLRRPTKQSCVYEHLPRLCGVDEAGLRSLAGPVVACAAILPLTGFSTRLLGALDGSKRLTAEVREAEQHTGRTGAR
jgi:hypothetical protein